MDYSSLENFICTEMKMTHIYQPLMIKTLLQSWDNRATAEQIARSFLNGEMSQIQHYKRVVGRWPRTTLTRHNIVSYDNGIYTLLLDGHITADQRHKLISMCDLRLQEFVDKNSWAKTSSES